MRWLALVTITTTLFSACESTENYRAPTGGLLGGGLGGFLGSHVGAGSGRVAAIAGGAVLGGLFGRGIGGLLDRAKRDSSSRVERYREAPWRPLAPIRNTPGYDISSWTAPYWWEPKPSSDFSPMPPLFAPDDIVIPVEPKG